MTPRHLRRLLIAAALALPALGILPTAAWSEQVPRAQRASAGPAESAARVVVKYRADGALMRAQAEREKARGASGGEGPRHAATLSQRLGVTLRDGFGLGSRTQVLHASGLSSAELVRRLRQDADVEWAEVDVRARIRSVPNDPLFADGQVGTPTVGQWYLRTPDANLVSAINAVQAWDITQGSSSVVVAVIDTGVRPDHPDLAGKLLPGRDFVSEVADANDGDGWDADPSDPGDWITSAEDASGPFAGCGAQDSSWHGTQVAGLIGAATNNGVGMAGAGRNVMILPVRALGKCGGRSSDIAVAMKWAAGLAVPNVPLNPNPAKVLNLSLGSPSTTCSDTYRDAVAAVTAAGVVVVAAAGNDTGHAVEQPANCSGVIAVAGIRHIGTKVGFSNVGPQVAIAAPGGNCVNTAPGSPCLYPLLTTTNTGTTAPGANTYSDSFNISVGTSFASPLVAATSGLMLSANPALTPAQVKAALQASARAFPVTGSDPATQACHAPDATDQLECYCTTSTCGAGMLDAQGAVARVSAAAPTAQIGVTPAQPVVGANITLSGAASVAANGRSITGYQWTLVSGNSFASFVGATNAVSATVATSAAGTFQVQLTVTDNVGIPSSTTISVTVSSPTTARVGVSNSTPVAGASVTLDGTGSSAIIGRTLSAYLWEITSGGNLASFSGSVTGSTATLVTSAAGNVTVRLTVTDSGGGSATASQTITISAPASSGGGGGGALSSLWLSGLALAVAALARVRRRP